MTPRVVRLLSILVLSCSLAPLARAQHATAYDIVGGKQAFMQFCANCHGPDGNLIANVDLGHGTFRKPYTDADLVGIIRGGIPNTPMPASPNINEEQAGKIVAYLRSRALDSNDSLAGDAAHGKALFEGRGKCLSCHRVDGQGATLATNLSGIGRLRTVAELSASLRDPDAVVQPDQRSYRVVTKTGREYTGRLLNHDVFTIQLLDTGEHLHSFALADLREHGFIASPMPALGKDYSEQDIADLVSYLATLRGDKQ